MISYLNLLIGKFELPRKNPSPEPLAGITMSPGSIRQNVIDLFRVTPQFLFQSESKCEFFAMTISSNFNVSEN